MHDAMKRIFRQSVRFAPAAFAAAALVVALPEPLAAEETTKRVPDASHGRIAAERSCANCHLVAADKSRAPVDGIPTFHAIATAPDQSAQRILGALINPHPPMPDTHLTQDEIEDIIAYLDSIRQSAGAGPPLIDKRPGKPDLSTIPRAG